MRWQPGRGRRAGRALRSPVRFPGRPEWHDASVRSSSGERSLGGRRAKLRPLRSACRRRSGLVGSERLVACHQSASSRSRGATCRSRSERSSPFSMPTAIAYGGSLSSWAGHINDLAGAATQRRHPWRPPRVSRHDRAVGSRSARQATEGGQARLERRARQYVQDRLAGLVTSLLPARPWLARRCAGSAVDEIRSSGVGIAQARRAGSGRGLDVRALRRSVARERDQLAGGHGGESRIRSARFPARKTLEEFDWTFQRSVKKGHRAPPDPAPLPPGQGERGAARATGHREDPPRDRPGDPGLPGRAPGALRDRDRVGRPAPRCPAVAGSATSSVASVGRRW